MTDLLEERTAAALRGHAVDVAPAMAFDADLVLRRGRRARSRRAAARGVGAVVGAGLLALGVAEVATPHREIVDIASWLRLTDPAPEDVVARLDPAVEPDPIPPRPEWLSLPFDASQARLLGATGVAEAYAGVHEGEICLLLVAFLRDGSPGAAGSSCQPPADVAADGITLSVGGIVPSTTAWLVPDGYGTPPEGFFAAGPNLWLSTPSYHRNESGQTYGPLAGTTPQTQPDLVAVVADDGQDGYVLLGDLAAVASSPADALRWPDEDRRGGSTVPVYESDGATRIGTFTVDDDPTEAS